MDSNSHPWNQLKEETSKSFNAFSVYLGIGIDRTLSATAKILEYKSVTQLDRWSSLYDWVERCRLYDGYLLEKDIEGRLLAREQNRQLIYDESREVIKVALSICKGKMPSEADATPILDRHGEVVGERAVIPAATILSACKFVLGLAGMVVPKALELSQQDNETEELKKFKDQLQKLSLKELSIISDMVNDV